MSGICDRLLENLHTGAVRHNLIKPKTALSPCYEIVICKRYDRIIFHLILEASVAPSIYFGGMAPVRSTIRP